MDGTPRGAPGPAAGNDVPLDDNPIRLLQRHVVQERLRLLFPRGARVLALGNRVDDEGAFLEAYGVRVHGPDESPRDLDGAYCSWEGLSAEELPRARGAVLGAVRPGGRVLLCLAGPSPLPALLERALTGKEEPGHQSRRGGEPGRPAEGAGPAQVRRTLGSGFAWTRLAGLGIFIPGPERAEWTRRNPQAFGMLAALEGVVRSWPVLRALGDRFLLEGRVAS